jgi:hypothetical protein
MYKGNISIRMKVNCNQLQDAHEIGHHACCVLFLFCNILYIVYKLASCATILFIYVRS